MLKNLSFIIIVLCAGVMIGVILGEGVVRVYLFGYDAFSYERIRSNVPIGVSGHLEKSKNDTILFALKQNIKGFHSRREFRTNALGFRDVECSMPKRSQTIRGLVIGDSWTMGAGVLEEETYHGVVERHLNHQFPSQEVELINLGVGGYNLFNYLGVLEEKSLRLEPDFIIFGFCGNNDFLHPKEKHNRDDYMVKERKNGFLKSYLRELALKALFRGEDISNYANRKVSQEELTFINSMFMEYKKFGFENDIPILIQYLSLHNRPDRLGSIKHIAHSLSIPFVDSEKDFSGKDIPQFYVDPLDPHPNKLAHEMFGMSLLNSAEFQALMDGVVSSDSVGRQMSWLH